MWDDPLDSLSREFVQEPLLFLSVLLIIVVACKYLPEWMLRMTTRLLCNTFEFCVNLRINVSGNQCDKLNLSLSTV